MRIFYAFLIVVTSAILFMLPITKAVYDFRTDLRTDTFITATAGVTSANETLLDALYGDDIGSIDIVSSNATDTPLPNSYNSTSQVLNIIGLGTNTSRTLAVSYDVDALESSSGISNLLDYIPFIWILICVAFGPAALFAIFTGRT